MRRITRNVTLDSSEPTLRVSYDITNLSGSSGTFDDLRLSQYIDYDIGAIGDDAGTYFKDEERGCEFISQSSSPTGDPIFSGFTGEAFSENHDLREYGPPDADGLSEDNFFNSDTSFNNENRHPDSGTSDVTLAMEWSLGELGPGESADLETAFVYNPSQQDFEDQLCAESPSEPAPSPGVRCPHAM